MDCFVGQLCSDKQVVSDLKTLIPDAALRRRMSRVVKMAVSTAVETLGGVEQIDGVDAILTATGWGCLADSEKFLRNVIGEEEQLLNPTPFIQSTFNTVGGQIALLRHNRCYNVTYVNRSHSFEDALLDGMMRLADGEANRVLLGAFDEMIPSLNRIAERMGWWRHHEAGEGAVFMTLTAEREEHTLARVVRLDFPDRCLTAENCMERYRTIADAELIYCDETTAEYCPTRSARLFGEAVERIRQGAKEVILYNNSMGMQPTVVVLQWVG